MTANLVGMALGFLLGAVGFAVLREAWSHWFLPLRGRLYQNIGQHELAVAAWRQYLTTRTLTGQRRKLAARFSLAHSLFSLGRYREAIVECDTLLTAQVGPSLQGLTHQMRADCLERLGDEPGAAAARASASDAFEATGEVSLYGLELAVDQREAEGDPFGALELLEALVEKALASGADQYQQTLRLRLARLRLSLGYYEAARMTSELLLGRAGLSTGLDHDARAIAARAYLELGRYDQAERDAQLAFRTANLAKDTNKLIQDCLLLAKIAMHRGDFVESMRQFQRVRECGGAGRWVAALGEADLLRLWGRTGEARRQYQLARERVPEAAATGDATSPADTHAALVVDLAFAAMLYLEEPAEAAALARPHRETPLRDPLLAVRRDIVATLALTAAGEPATSSWERALAARQTFGHDRHLMVELDLAEAQLATWEGRLEDAALAYERALGRPPHAILRPTVETRYAAVVDRAGRVAEATGLWLAAARFEQPLGAVEAARTELARRGLDWREGLAEANKGEPDHE